MLAAQLEMTTRIVTALKAFENVLIELVFTTDGLAVGWAAELVKRIRAVDPARVIVLPTQWAPELLPASGIKSVISCGERASPS